MDRALRPVFAKVRLVRFPFWIFFRFWIISIFIVCKWSGKLAFTVSNLPKFYHHHHRCRRHLCEGFCLQDFRILLILWESNIVNTVCLAVDKRFFMAVSKKQLISVKDASHTFALYRNIISSAFILQHIERTCIKYSHKIFHVFRS